MRHVVSAHYARRDLQASIEAGLDALDLSPETVAVDDLAQVDEFHIGGRAATEAFMAHLPIKKDERWLDIGCGLGGAARFAASNYGCRIMGLDITPDYIDVGTTLCDWVGLGGAITLELGSALRIPHTAEHFDGAYMLHVGMNIPDKARLFAEVYRVLKPGGTYGIYDITHTGVEGDLAYPVPWTTHPYRNHTTTPAAYEAMLVATGFTLQHVEDRTAFALNFFEEMRQAHATATQPNPLGLNILMQDSTKTKVGNVVAGLKEGLIAPTVIIAKKD